MALGRAYQNVSESFYIIYRYIALCLAINAINVHSALKFTCLNLSSIVIQVFTTLHLSSIVIQVFTTLHLSSVVIQVFTTLYLSSIVIQLAKSRVQTTAAESQILHQSSRPCSPSLTF